MGRRVIAAWRKMIGGEGGGAPTLIACSGGADSCALALCLAAARPEMLCLAYVQHPMRERAVTEAEAEFVRGLATGLGVAFDRATLTETPEHRTEAGARRSRYAALAAMAAGRGVRFIATAHHADDQLETMLMALARGAGPRGLAGIRPRRLLAGPDGSRMTVIRPMLRCTREETESICAAAGVRFAVDATNTDTTRFRAAVRGLVLPALRELRPAAAVSAARSADVLRDAARVVRDEAAVVFGRSAEGSWGVRWPRAPLRASRSIVIAEGLRCAAGDLLGGAKLDRLGQRIVWPAAEAIRDASTEPRSFDWPGGVRVRVLAHEVIIESAAARTGG